MSSSKFGVVTICFSLLIVGCGTPESSQIDQLRQQFLVESIGGAPTSLATALELEDRQPELVLAGKIYGGDLSPFDAKKASFTIVELPEPGHNHDDPGDCVFCKRKLDEAAMAAVHLVDDQSATIELPADKLLGLTSKMSVMVKGKTKRVGDMLIVQATELCILDDAKAAELSAAFRQPNPTDTP